MNIQELEEFHKKYGAIDEFGSIADDILPVLNEWRDWPWGGQPNFWATDAGKCDRRMWLTMWNIPQSNSDLSDESFNTFALGDMVESHVVSKYRRLRGFIWEQAGGSFQLTGDPEFDREVDGAQDRYGIGLLKMFLPKVTYKMDIVFDDVGKQFAEQPRRYIVEVKSIKDWPFDTHKRNGEDTPYFYGLDTVPNEGYYLQLCQYLYYEKTKDGLLHFVNKNTGEERLWHVDLEAATRAVEGYVLPKYRKLWTMYVTKQMPERNHHVEFSKAHDRILSTGSDYECRYCPFADRCWGIGKYEPLENVEQLGEWLDGGKKTEPTGGIAGERQEDKVAEGSHRRHRRQKTSEPLENRGGAADGVQT